MHSNQNTPKLIIEGNGPLKGAVIASGAKNAVLPILAATILASEPVVLHNVPKLQDVIVLTDLLQDLGAKVEINEIQSRLIQETSIKLEQAMT